ncbi:DUF3298 and DUF4163 domain-containing protein [Chitinophaga nivalis]|uniref:DUF3298 and DUF4163 domain-containing protein n=1 Tax=Chitinophaga nivalis TaxID=2991709 RepID=A0ABT3IVM0_9BACT|nr:DUF3298 and DUF4163 domain-containing protein [Chitinophaga nivalis]MCW3462273.1 DUF3298 and DUF4163 domain-containing protein [Chitinophaga nivalis]MCW3488036.1 DUF3298 and DUF4163 domain-containing protein [Chitinophaga nivalis]
MKRVSILCLLAATLLLSCNSGGNNHSNTADDSTASLVVPLVSTPYFYTQLKGQLNGQDIILQLLKTAPQLYRGSYCFDSTGSPIGLWGSLDSGLVKLYEENSGEEERVFSGHLTDDGHFKGVWHGDGTSHHFELHTDLKNALPLTVYYASDSARLLPAHPQSPVGIVSNSIVWPVAGTDTVLATLLQQNITGSSRFHDPQQYLKKEIDSFIMSYQLSARDADSTELNDATQAMSWNWSTDNYMRVIWNTWPMLVLEKYNYDFTGGAHGNWGATYISIDRSKKKVITPDDLFKPGYKEVLSGLLDKAYREKYQIPEDEPLGQNLLVKSISPNNNLIVTGKGVAFSYVPYEIGPYALGQVTLFIPAAQLKSILK